MTPFLWQDDTTNVDEECMRYLAGEDIVRDGHLFRYGIEATKANVVALIGTGNVCADLREPGNTFQSQRRPAA